MVRYLLFDASCPVCTRTAHRVCNHSGDWIDDVLSLQENQAVDLLVRGGAPGMARPALIECDGDRVKIIHGFRLRWCFLRRLGLIRTIHLARIVGGDLSGEVARRRDEDLGAARRTFLSKAIKAGIAVGVVVGVGHIGAAFGRSRPSDALMDALTEFRNLPGQDVRKLTGYDRSIWWTKFRYSSEIESLVRSTELDTAVPADASRIRKTLQMDVAPDAFFAVQRVGHGGEEIMVLTVAIGNAVVADYQLSGSWSALCL